MMEDFNQRFQNVGRERAACLKAIGDLLRARGKSLNDYGLPNPDDNLLEPDQDDQMFGAIDAVVAWQQRLRDLNDEQRTVYDRVMAAVDDNRNVQKMFYVDGPGGTGKTTLYGCLISSLRNRQQTVLSVAYTGIAASLMEGGMTVHSTFGLPLGTLTEQSTSSITMQSLRAQRIREASLIVWDEAPMSPGLQFTVVDRLLKDIMGSALPFGGKPILLAGDFRQILPVVRRGNRSSIVMSSIKRHSLWREFEQFRLTRNMRNIILPAVSMTSGEEDDLPFRMKRIQFPVRLSFAMTINKSQGQTVQGSTESVCSCRHPPSAMDSCTLRFQE
ncbi:ATP-dependent DNA helicase PIF2-like [Metopolophium dirhodum]|uniref:ATP-dependent DNA helicase PIF2-like n=1 Tax=Metopolophium dirhodum TaxID=44670 RepID=UPI002990659F|nr:ATP-dependent DNA helicase PIF2-like [Metopolophium dirhodum]